MSEKIRIVVAEPGKLPAVSFITDSLKGMQQIVGGFADALPAAGNLGDGLEPVMRPSIETSTPDIRSVGCMIIVAGLCCAHSNI